MTFSLGMYTVFHPRHEHKRTGVGSCGFQELKHAIEKKQNKTVECKRKRAFPHSRVQGSSVAKEVPKQRIFNTHDDNNA